MSKNSPELEALVQDFVSRLVAVIEEDVAQRIQGVVASALGSPTGRKARASQPGRRPVVVSRELAAARKLQGQYLGALRGLKPTEHARVKAVAHEKGLPAAIKMAHSLKQ